jgi:hypothetical protein
MRSRSRVSDQKLLDSARGFGLGSAGLSASQVPLWILRARDARREAAHLFSEAADLAERLSWENNILERKEIEKIRFKLIARARRLNRLAFQLTQLKLPFPHTVDKAVDKKPANPAPETRR